MKNVLIVVLFIYCTFTAVLITQKAAAIDGASIQAAPHTEPTTTVRKPFEVTNRTKLEFGLFYGLVGAVFAIGFVHIAQFAKRSMFVTGIVMLVALIHTNIQLFGTQAVAVFGIAAITAFTLVLANLYIPMLSLFITGDDFRLSSEEKERIRKRGPRSALDQEIFSVFERTLGHNLGFLEDYTDSVVANSRMLLFHQVLTHFDASYSEGTIQCADEHRTKLERARELLFNSPLLQVELEDMKFYYPLLNKLKKRTIQACYQYPDLLWSLSTADCAVAQQNVLNNLLKRQGLTYESLKKFRTQQELFAELEELFGATYPNITMAADARVQELLRLAINDAKLNLLNNIEQQAAIVGETIASFGIDSLYEDCSRFWSDGGANSIEIEATWQGVKELLRTAQLELAAQNE